MMKETMMISDHDDETTVEKNAAVAQFIEHLRGVETAISDLASAMAAAVTDCEHLARSGYREGSRRGVDNLLGAGASVDSLWGKARGRCRALGLERLLEGRQVQATDDGWIEDIRARLGRVVV
jgi:hypothetical protein